MVNYGKLMRDFCGFSKGLMRNVKQKKRSQYFSIYDIAITLAFHEQFATINFFKTVIYKKSFVNQV